jgi:hypothetical protein
MDYDECNDYDNDDYDNNKLILDNFLNVIKIIINKSNINIIIYKNNNKNEVEINLSENILDFKDFIQFLDYSLYVPTHLFIRTSNNKSVHSMIFNCTNTFTMMKYSHSYSPFRKPYIYTKKIYEWCIFNNQIINNIMLSDIKINLDKNFNDTILIYFNEVISSLPTYIHSSEYSNIIQTDIFCKYITIIFDEICDYDYTMNNILDIKINNIDVKFKCIFKNLNYNSISNSNSIALYLIFISIDNINLSYMYNKNCIECIKHNKFSDLPKFKKLINNNRDKFNNKLNQIIPNILDCTMHYNQNHDIFRKFDKNKFNINVADILSKLNLSTTQKIFRIRYNYI